MKNFIACMFFCSVFVNIDLAASRRRDRVVPYGLAVVGVQVKGGRGRASRPSTPVLVRNAYKVLQQTARKHSDRLDEITVLTGDNFDRHNVVQSQLGAVDQKLSLAQRHRVDHDNSLKRLLRGQGDLRDEINILKQLFLREHAALRDRVARADVRNENLAKKNAFLAGVAERQAVAIEKLQDENSDLRGLVGTLSASINNIARDGDDVYKDLSQFKKKYQERAASMQEWYDGMDSWADSVDPLARKVPSLETRMDSLEALLKSTAE
jgi:chromosome segregation ATPase